MRAWTSDDFPGVWPVGTAAVIVAPDEAAARELLRKAVVNDDFTLVEVDLSKPQAIVLRDGSY